MHFFIFTLLFSTASLAFAREEATIYGGDNREEVSDVGLTKLSLPVVVAIPGQYTASLPIIKAPSLEKRFNLCPGDRYAHQPSIGNCTGVHIGKGLVLAPAHCVYNKSSCEKYHWAFNYRTNVVGEKAGKISLKDIYKCASIVATDPTLDVTILQLEANASKHASMKFNPGAKVSAKVFAMGYPLGMPLKFSGKGRVTKQLNGSAYAAIDTFVGNSGSPIMNEKHEWIGMLLGGNTDFVTSESGCRTNFVTEPTKAQESFLILNTLPPHIKKYLAP